MSEYPSNYPLLGASDTRAILACGFFLLNNVDNSWCTNQFVHIVIQVTVEASDSGTPKRRASAQVNVIIDRNIKTPTFIGSLIYNKEIFENQLVLRSIIKLTAIDQDKRVNFILFLSLKFLYSQRCVSMLLFVSIYRTHKVVMTCTVQ
jgi:hypothetical protein